MSRSRHQFAVLAAIAGAAVSAFPLAQAARAADTDTQTRVVSLRGLDLTSADGQALLRHRIEQAVNIVCERPDPRELGAAKSYEACRKLALDNAYAQADAKIAAAIARTRFVANGTAWKAPAAE